MAAAAAAVAGAGGGGAAAAAAPAAIPASASAVAGMGWDWIGWMERLGVEWMRPLVGSVPYILLHAQQGRSSSAKQR